MTSPAPESLRLLGVPALPAPPAASEPHAHGMLLARHWAIRSPDPVLRSGAVALRNGRLLAAATDSTPPGVRDTIARRRHRDVRRQMLCSAPAALVAHAARHGISLHGSSIYVWPLLDGAPSAALLIAAGCLEIVTLDAPYPARLEADITAVQQMAAEAGVLLAQVAPPAEADTLSPLGTFSEQADRQI